MASGALPPVASLGPALPLSLPLPLRLIATRLVTDTVAPAVAIAEAVAQVTGGVLLRRKRRRDVGGTPRLLRRGFDRR